MIFRMLVEIFLLKNLGKFLNKAVRMPLRIAYGKSSFKLLIKMKMEKYNFRTFFI